jgi:hypothetical protein
MTNQFQRTFMLGGAAVVALTVFTSNVRSASAASIVMQGAQSVTTDMGNLDQSAFADNLASTPSAMIDRDLGKTTTSANVEMSYVNGEDQATYLAKGAKGWDGHSSEWFSAANKTSGNIDFNLGNSFSVANVVIWNEDIFGIKNFDIWASDNSGFAGATKFLGYTAVNQAVSGSPIASYLETAQVFDIAPTTAQFIRLVINDTYPYSGRNRDTRAGIRRPPYQTASIGEVAFGVKEKGVPTPALLPGLIGLGATAWRKRRQANAAI